MAIMRLPRRGIFLRPFSSAGAKRGASRAGNSSPIPDPPARTISEEVCGICGQTITEGEATVQIRHGATSQDPTPPLLPAHAVCFRNELLPRW